MTNIKTRALGLVVGVLFASMTLASVTLAGSLQRGQGGGQGQGVPGGQGGQRGPGMGQRGGPQSIAMLAARPEVAQEIGLTDEQGQALRAALDAARPARPQQGQNQGQGGPRPDPATMRKEMEARNAALDKKAASILSAAQYARVEEISIQMRGLGAALDPKVQVKLNVTATQKRALDALAERQGGPGRGGPGMGGPGMGGPEGEGGPGGPPPEGEGPGGPPPNDDGQGGPPPPPPGEEGQGGPGGRGQRGPGMGGRNGQIEAEIANILTDAQKAKLKALGGKPFNFQRGPEGRVRPGGPGGPGDLTMMAAVLGVAID